MSSEPQPMSENTGTRAPCGCVFGNKGQAFVIKPCSESCEVYAYAVEQARKKGKPIRPIDLRHSGQLPFSAHCPFCGQGADGFTGPDHDPRPGDRSLCVYCARIGIYTAHGIRKPTPEEQAENDDDEAMKMMAQAARKAIRNRNLSHPSSRVPPT